MSDQNKLALLCILIVFAVAVWNRPNNLHGPDGESSGEDVFQNTHAKQESPFTGNLLSDAVSEEHHKLLAKTAEGDFQKSPFD